MKLGLPSLKLNKQTGLNERTFHLTVKICLSLVLYALFTVLFYRQAVQHHGGYGSDLPAHIEASIIGGDYSILYLIMGIIFGLTQSNLAIALFESGIVILTFLMSEKYIRKMLESNGSFAVWISAGAIFLCSVYIPRFYQYYYKWTLITQPWHNITYFGMRLFSVPVFFYTLGILGRYRSCFTWKDWFSLAIPLLLSTSIKPNFFAGYSLTLLCVLIADFTRDFFKKELSVPSFLRYISLGSTVFPAVIILFYQMFVLYGEQNGVASDSGMAIVFLTSQFFALGMIPAIIGIVRDCAFPFLVLIYGAHKISREEKFVVLLFAVSLIQRIMLAETGLRAEHLNFTWGIYNAGYLLFLYMIPRFIQLVKTVSWKQKSFKDKGLTLIGSGILCAHLLFGLKYFLVVFSGEWFYI